MNFNSRSPEESDLKAESSLIKKLISIHALLKRATWRKTSAYVHRYISIHALLKRATFTHSVTRVIDFISIHALLKRATLLLYFHSLFLLYFNSRSPEESDGWLGVIIRVHSLFQFTLSWRERQICNICICFLIWFQFTLSWRERHNFIHSVYARSKEKKKALQTKLFNYLLKIKKN